MKKISIIIPVYNVNHERFKKTLKSLVNQTNKNFEVCISDGGNKSSVEKVLDEFREKLDIKYLKSNKSLGISENTNCAIQLSNGDYLSFLDHDDLLLPTAIEDVLNIFQKNNVDVVYTDEQIVDENGNVLNRFYKPDFSNDLLYSQNYICHFLTIKRDIVEKVGLFDKNYDGAQDYDYILRISELTNKIYHLPKILYSWLSTAESTSTNSDSKPYAQKAGLNALNSHLKRIYNDHAKAVETDNLFVYNVEFDYLKNQKVDIIIAMKDKWYLTKQCVDSILNLTNYDNYQITIINNNSVDSLSLKWLDDVQHQDKKVRVLDANFEFNWSKLQNFGIKHSEGADVFVFLNNDTIIIDPNWLSILCSNALRREVGVVGPLLLYDDETIQHAGIIIGMGGYADHVFKGMKPIHANINYVSPMVNRNVLAVTGACMAISKNTLNEIGYFNENFIICGSDVEICLRAYEKGLRNIYIANTKLIHLESKSRDTYIPLIDFKLSKVYYSKYFTLGDPFYNINLDYNNVVPTVAKNGTIYNRKVKVKLSQRIKDYMKNNKVIVFIYQKLKDILRKNKYAVKIYRKIRHLPTPNGESYINNRLVVNYTIPEIKKIFPIECKIPKKYRINILIPSLNKDKVFGGIATAMKFFNSFNNDEFCKRIIVCDTTINEEDLDNYKEYKLLENNEKSNNVFQVVNISDTNNCNLTVSENDIFIATAWWTAYNIKPVIEWQKENYNLPNFKNLIYFIQDYEPYFYPWSSRQSSAESTYRLKIPVIAVFNSKELMEYFDKNNYKFQKKYFFSPILNDKLKYHLINDEELPRKKQIIIYGRPSVPRNAFEIIEESLIKAFENRSDVTEWKIISMGEDHYDAYVNEKLSIISVGKLSIDNYAKMMEESYIGISLMVSPHPSYPPLEMSSFGVKTITNNYGNKDISYFNENIISVKFCDSEYISKELIKLMNSFDSESKTCKKVINDSYVNSTDQFNVIINDIINDIFEE